VLVLVSVYRTEYEHERCFGLRVSARVGI
jgi:hypothetical protein